MIRVYVAGPYSGNTIQTLGNIRRGIGMSVKLLLRGYFPYCPWLDWLYGLFSEVPIELYQANSIAWLKVAQAVLVLEGWENSTGTKAEIEIAKREGIPVFYSIEALVKWVENERWKTGA